VHHRKKPLWRRAKHRLKPVWREYWTVAIAVVLGLFAAFYIIPVLIGFLIQGE
jgi:preprotein translocase subunit Sss1